MKITLEDFEYIRRLISSLEKEALRHSSRSLKEHLYKKGGVEWVIFNEEQTPLRESTSSERLILNDTSRIYYDLFEDSIIIDINKEVLWNKYQRVHGR